jgi:D-alanyl-D-alanine carboxypeptidase
VSNLLSELHPLLIPTCREHLAAAWTDKVLVAKAMTPELDDTARDDTAQLANWLKGRNNAGEIINAAAVVTNSRPGQSYHNVRYPTGKACALAYHIRLRDSSGKLVGWPDAAPMDDEAYERLGLLGEQLGLVWGGRWKTPHDPCHYELHPNGATLAQVLAVIKEQGDIPGFVA